MAITSLTKRIFLHKLNRSSNRATRSTIRCSQKDDEPFLIDHRHSPISGRLRVAKMPPTLPSDSPYYKELQDAIALLIGSEQDCIHSVYRPYTVLTNGCWDVFGVLPSFIPLDGVIGIYGLGAGTIPRLIHHFYPDRKMIGWELDPDIVDLARRHMGLDVLEATGHLDVIVGDCFAETATVPGCFAGLIVDVYTGDEIHSSLSNGDVWKMLQSRMQPEGRIIANLEPPELLEMFIAFDGNTQWHVHPTSGNITAMSGALPSPLQWKNLPSELLAVGCAEGWKRQDFYEAVRQDDLDILPVRRSQHS